MDERLSKAEIRKDAVQNTVEAAAGTVGQVASIITGAVKEVAESVGGLATELFEIRDQARRAAADHGPSAASPADPGLHADPDASGPAESGVHLDPDAPTA